MVSTPTTPVHPTPGRALPAVTVYSHGHSASLGPSRASVLSDPHLGEIGAKQYELARQNFDQTRLTGFRFSQPGAARRQGLPKAAQLVWPSQGEWKNRLAMCIELDCFPTIQAAWVPQLDHHMEHPVGPGQKQSTAGCVDVYEGREDAAGLTT